MIKNKRNGKKLEMEYEVADTLVARMEGLMFASAPKCIFFKFERAGNYPIHSFFVFFRFDAAYIDAKMRVSEIFESVLPFTPLVTPKKDALYLLEMPDGCVKKLALKVGDKVELE